MYSILSTRLSIPSTRKGISTVKHNRNTMSCNRHGVLSNRHGMFVIVEIGMLQGLRRDVMLEAFSSVLIAKLSADTAQQQRLLQ